MLPESNFLDKTVLVFDFGNYLPIAQRLARDFGTVLYYCPSVINGFEGHEAADIGRGVSGIVKVKDWEPYKYEIDLFVFTDVYYTGLQESLRKEGRAVFGGGRFSEFEKDRLAFKNLLKDLELPVNEYDVAIGVPELIEKLKSVDDRYIKSTLRGDNETWHHKNYVLSKIELKKMLHNMGVYDSEETYIIESPIEAIAEIGYDGYCVDGSFPEISCSGIEIKDCYDDQTEVLTNEGWKLFKNLNKNEEVLTLNISDRQHILYEYQKPTDYIKNHYNGDLIYIEKDSVSLCITPTHNILVQDGIQNEQAQVVEWCKYKPGRLIGEKHAFKRGKRVLRLQKAIDVVNRNKRFSLLQPKGRIIPNNPNNRGFKIDGKWVSLKKMARLMGIYLSEGHTRFRNGKYQVNISQFKYVEEFKDILSDIPFLFTKVKTGFNCYNYELGKYLYQFNKAKDKFIPDWIKQSGVGIINAFLDAYCLGDGTRAYNYKKIRKDSPIYNENFTRKELTSRYFYTASKRMADDLQELLVKIGSVAVSRVDKIYYNETLGEYANMYGVVEKLINRKNYIFPQDISYIPYDGDVYCVTVPNSIIMIRRNGKSMWCGNCAYAGRMTRFDRLPKQAKESLDKLSPVLMDYGYRGAISTEVRIDKDKVGYFIDPTLRMPCPNTFLTLEMYENYSEIIWDVAHGIVPKIKYKFEYGVEFIIKSDRAKTMPVALQFPAEYERFIKIKNLVIDNEGTYYFTKNNTDLEQIGSVIGLGHTMEQAVKMATSIAETIKGFDIKINTDCTGDIQKQLKELSKHGIRFIQ